jgi:hypothetical protein
VNEFEVEIVDKLEADLDSKDSMDKKANKIEVVVAPEDGDWCLVNSNEEKV